MTKEFEDMFEEITDEDEILRINQGRQVSSEETQKFVQMFVDSGRKMVKVKLNGDKFGTVANRYRTVIRKEFKDVDDLNIITSKEEVYLSRTVHEAAKVVK